MKDAGAPEGWREDDPGVTILPLESKLREQYEKQLRENHGPMATLAATEVPEIQDDQRARELLGAFKDMLKPNERQIPGACGTFLRQLADMSDRETGAQSGNMPETDPSKLEEGQGEEPGLVAMDEVGEILKAKFESDVWDLRSKGEEGDVKEVAAGLLLDYVTGHINRLKKEHLEESK